MVSERRACRVLSQPRMTQRYEATRPDDEERLVARMRGLATKHPRYGYRRIWALLRREGWSINRKRVHCLWSREGLKVKNPGHSPGLLKARSEQIQLRGIPLLMLVVANVLADDVFGHLVTDGSSEIADLPEAAAP